jgi:hypothetical protein
MAVQIERQRNPADETPLALLDGDGLAALEFMPKPLEAERFVGMVKSLHYSLLTELVAGSMV